MSGSPLDPLVHLLTTLALNIGGAVFATVSTVLFLRFLGLHWTWTLPGVLLGPLLWPFDQGAAGFVAATAVFATATGARWHHDDLRHGGDQAQDARDRRTLLDAARERLEHRSGRGVRWIDRRGLAVGRDERGRTVRIPTGHASGRHTLVVGATGSGKTVTQAWIAGRMIEAGHGAVVIDPKGDPLLREELERAARRARRTFRLWTPEGPGIYNPFAHGTDTELADKILAGEPYTEPHYLRQAQRYLGHAVRTLKSTRRPVSVAMLTDAMIPERLEYFARTSPSEEEAKRVHDYVDSLSAEQRRGLAGTRDRLAILAESEVSFFLYSDKPTRHHIDLLGAVNRRDIVLFRLDADRRPLLASMLAAAIVQDLLTIAAELQAHPIPTLVLVDEFSAIAPGGVVRLFGRGRSAGLSLLLGTQELADLRPPDNPSLADQVLGNLTTLIAHRQVVPQSAETLAGVMGTRGAWTHTEKTENWLAATSPTGEGTRTRTREFVVHPDTIKRLPTGTAAVTSPGHGQPRIARMNHPEDAR
jgi:type IV secretory pathway TraG/TraD family ATPase VirD4